jgi:hypothetical protein
MLLVQWLMQALATVQHMSRVPIASRHCWYALLRETTGPSN